MSQTVYIKALLVLGLFLFQHFLRAQEIFFELQVDPNPPVYAYEWEQNPELVVMYVTSISSGPVDVKLRGRLFNSAGDLAGETDDFAVPLVTLQPEQNILYPGEIIPSSAFLFYGDFEENVIRTNRIPEDNYTLCAEIIDPETLQPLTAEQCAYFYVQGYEPPFLIYPEDGAEFTEEGLMDVVFQWTPVNPAPPSMFVFYKFGLFELFEGQEPREAILSNPPVYEEMVPGETAIPYPPDIIIPRTGQEYVWSVQPSNEAGELLTGGDGWSEPFTIYIEGDTVITATKEPVITKEPVVTKEPVPGDTIVEEEDTVNTVTPYEPYHGRIVLDTVWEEDSTWQYTQLYRLDTTYRDRSDTIIEDLPPIEEVPPDTIITPKPELCGPSFRKEPANPIDLGMILENPDLFQYPRAVPIRAEGVDFDYAIFRCQGCDGRGEYFKAVEDHVTIFNWKLNGKGSLNTPFDLEKIQESQDRVDEINARLQEINDSLRYIDEQVNEVIPGKLDETVSRIKEKKGELADKDSLLTVLEQKRDSVATHIDSLVPAITGQEELLRQQLDSIQIHRDKIDSIQAILKGKPSAEMLAQMEVVNTIRDLLDQVKQELENKEQEIIDESTRLMQSIEEADAAIDDALQNYKDLKSRAEELGMEISETETTIMVNPKARDYLREKREWDLKVLTFLGTWMGNDTNYYILNNLRVELNGKGRSAISTGINSQRQQRFAEFELFMNSFKSRILNSCAVHSGSDWSDCRADAMNVNAEGDEYLEAVDEVVNSSYVYNVTYDNTIDSLRQQLEELESSVVAAKQEVENKKEEYAGALDEYTATITGLEEEKSALAENVSSVNDSLTGEELRYKQIAEAYRDSVEANRDNFMLGIHNSRTVIAGAENKISGINDSLQVLYADTTAAGIHRDELSREIEDAETNIKRLEKLIENFEGLIDAFKERIRELNSLKERLLAEKEELEKEKEEEEEEEEQSFLGKKEARGPVIYYIPPPLEEIIKQQDLFAELKKKVEEAEDSLAIAYDIKQQVQQVIAKETERVGRELGKYKTIKDQLDSLNSEKSAAEAELAVAKNQKTLEYQNKQLELQDDLDAAELRKENAEQKQAELEQDSTRVRAGIETAVESIVQQDTLISQLRRNVTGKEAQLRYEENLFNNARATGEGIADDLRAKRNELLSLEDKLGRLNNDLTRAHARDATAAVNEIRAEIEETETGIEQLETEIDELGSSLASNLQSVESAKERVNNAEEILINARKDVSEAVRQKSVLNDSLVSLNERLEEILSDLSYWRSEEQVAREDIVFINRERRNLQDEISTQVNNDETVKALEKRLSQIEKLIEECEAETEAIVTKINESISKKDDAINEADEQLEEAKDRLKKAKEDLRQFLFNEFNTVNFSVSLELHADDKVIDGFRSDDPRAKMVKKLSYENNRTPVFASERAQDNLSDKSTGSGCTPAISVTPAGPPNESKEPFPGKEPRTIALVYKNGEPLWPEWPVIPANQPLLAKDVVIVNTQFTHDFDRFIHTCKVTADDCIPAKPVSRNAIDLGRHSWTVDGKIISQNPLYNIMLWEPSEVEKPLPGEEKEIKVTYTANKLAADPIPEQKSKPMVKPGALLEVNDSIVGTPESSDTVQARVVTGDHIGLEGEDIEFSLQLIDGYAEDYGFEGGDSVVTRKTRDGGYAKVSFNYGKGFAKWKIYVKWKRGDVVIEEDEFEAISPIRLQLLRFNAGPTTEQWEAALTLMEGGDDGQDQIDNLVASFTQTTVDDSTAAPLVHAVAGLVDEERDFVEEELTIFEPGGSFTVEPDSVETAVYGLSRTEAEDLPEKTQVRIISNVEDKFAAVGRPGTAESSYSTEKIHRFKIGSEDNLFTIELDEPVSDGETVEGTGRFGLEIADGLLVPLQEISLNINEVELEGEPDNKIAVSGSVSWASSPPLSHSMLGFDLGIDSITITASMGAGVGGTVNHSSLDNAVRFYAELEPNGDFLGRVDSLPAAELSEFRIKEGTSFTFDMHTARSASSFTSDWKGIVIHSAAVQLPPVFNRTAGGVPTTISGRDLYVGSSGFGGELALSGSLVSMEFTGYKFEVDSLTVTISDNEVTEAGFGGKIWLPSPFEGSLRGFVSMAGNGWAANITTDDPVSIPRLATTFTLMNGTGLSYSEAESLATFRLNAVISGEDYGDITVQGVEVTSEGDVRAENIAINKAIEFGSGFELHVESFSFSAYQEEYAISLTGGFGIPLIGLDQLTGTVAVEPGPTASVTFDKAEISFDKNPVKFKGSFSYSGREFKGEFEITIEKLRQLKGISGMLVVGNELTEAEDIYTYWYVEMVLAGAVPIGQTGLSLLELGGGVGYNYFPPVGSQPGSPSYTDAFSFKAIIGMGTAPGGEVLAGRMEMVLVPGSFTLYGKLWILQQEESMYGEGTIGLYWDPVNKVEGYVAMFVGIPDAEGDIFIFEGKINYLFSPSDMFIRSESIRGAFLQALQASASIDITSEHIKLDGRLWYNFNGGIPIWPVEVLIVINVDASGHFHYYNARSELDVGVAFHGDWDVDLDTPLGTADIISGAVDLSLNLKASPTYLSVEGEANVSWDVWFYEDSAGVEVGYETYL